MKPSFDIFDDNPQRDILRRLSSLERPVRLGFSSIGAGGLKVRDGGAINLYDADGNLLAVLDSSGLDVGPGLVTVDAGGLSVGNAPVVVDAGGLDVGSGLALSMRTG